MIRIPRPLALTALVTLAVALFAFAGRGSAGGIDLTGDWDFLIGGDVTFNCEAGITQTGTTVTGTFVCTGASGSFSGTVNPQGAEATLELALTLATTGGPSISANAEGTVEADGGSFSGTWEAAIAGLTGTFGATRAVSAPTPEPSASPTSTPAPTSGPALTQGDVDCDEDVDSVDALKQLRHVAALGVSQEPGCPDIGSEVASIFGDVDCDNDVDSVDALKVLRHVAALPVSQNDPCPDVGTPLG